MAELVLHGPKFPVLDYIAAALLGFFGGQVSLHRHDMQVAETCASWRPA